MQYSTDKNFKNAKSVRTKNTAFSVTLKNLKSKTTYYVRIRIPEMRKTEAGKKEILGFWTDGYKVKTK